MPGIDRDNKIQYHHTLQEKYGYYFTLLSVKYCRYFQCRKMKGSTELLSTWKPNRSSVVLRLSVDWKNLSWQKDFSLCIYLRFRLIVFSSMSQHLLDELNFVNTFMSPSGWFVISLVTSQLAPSTRTQDIGGYGWLTSRPPWRPDLLLKGDTSILFIGVINSWIFNSWIQCIFNFILIFS